MSSDTETVTEKHPVDQTLPFPQMFTYGLQHVLSMYAGVVAVPLIVGTALKLSGPEITYLVSAGLFISGLATLLQTLGVAGRHVLEGGRRVVEVRRLGGERERRSAARQRERGGGGQCAPAGDLADRARLAGTVCTHSTLLGSSSGFGG